MKRLFCIIGSLLICTSSVFAWNAESFLSDGSAEYQPYELDPVEDPALDPGQVPMMLSLDDGIAVAAESGSSSSWDFSSFFDHVSMVDKIGVYTSVFHEEVTINTGQETIVIPEWYEARIYPDEGALASLTKSSTGYNWLGRSVNVPSKLNGGVVEKIGTTVSYDDSLYWSDTVVFEVDISAFGDFNTFGFSGSLRSQSFLSDRSTYSWLTSSHPYKLQIVVDGVLQREYESLTGSFDFSDFIYSGSSNVESIELRFSYYLSSVDYVSSVVAPGVILYDSSSFSFDILHDDLVLSGFNDQAQNKINEHQSIESEWTGSMTQNFNALDLSGFTFPGGLVSAFALITGIFNDLWNGMGDYKILYVFPLTLGVVLLLIGRISKFSGRSSSGRGGKGDDSA